MSKTYINIDLPGKGQNWKVKGPENTIIRVSGIRQIPKEQQELLQHLPKFDGEVIIPLSGTAALIPAYLTTVNPDCKIKIFEMDSHEQRVVERKIATFDNITTDLVVDIPKTDAEKAMGILLVEKNSDRLLMFEMLERFNIILPDASPLFITVPRNRSKDFDGKIKKLYKKVAVIAKNNEGMVFKAVTNAAKQKWSERLLEFEADIQEANVALSSRPGIFCHGRTDTGGIALAELADIPSDHKVLELGSGCGITGLLLAKKWINSHDGDQAQISGSIHMVDSFIRSTEISRKNIETNNMTDFVTVETNDFLQLEEEIYDSVICNPPYYAGQRIADYFISVAAQGLKVGGKLYIVSKHGETIREFAESYAFSVELLTRKGYDISVCTKEPIDAEVY